MVSENHSVTLEYRNGVGEILIRREASLNALDADVLQRILDHLYTLSQNSRGPEAYQRCRVVIIRGEGEKAFAAGADIKLMAQASRRELFNFISLGQHVMREIELLPLPVIAVLNGFAIGGGLELALACDFIVATDRAKLGQAEVNLGLIPGFGGTQRLIHRVGIGAAKRLTFTGEIISAEDAFRMGLCDWFVKSTELEGTLSQICSTLATRGPLAISAAKRSIERTVEQAKLSGLSKEIEEFISLFETKDTHEGLQAFIEKRKANFLGR